MAVKTVQYIFNGQTYNLTYNSTTKKYEATVTAPSKSSYNQTDHVLGGTVKATDQAGNVTTVDQTHSTLGASLKLRVKEKVAPVISITAPSAGAYITNTTPTIEFSVTDADSGVNSGTIAVTIDGTAISSVTKTAITGGYKCTCTPAALKDGAHTISVTASDNDGNAASAKTSSFTVDTVPPTLSVTAPTPFTILSATYILSRFGEVEAEGECDINGHYLDIKMEPKKKTKSYILEITYAVADSVRKARIEVEVV